MSAFSTVVCDAMLCGTETAAIENYSGADMDSLPEGWGKVGGHDEHYCNECWPDYCIDNGVDPKTGIDLESVSE